MKNRTESLARLPIGAFTLKNGLKVYTFSVPESARVYADLWFCVGAKHESNNLHGVSHFLEHMVFKGSERYGPGKIDKLTSQAGGFNNAATCTEFTHFYFVLPKRKLALALDLLREMCTKPKIDEREFEREREVVIEEIKQYADNPFHYAYLKHMLSFYSGTPWGHNILGTADSLNALSPDMMRSYHRKHYSPSNAALVISGGIPEFDDLESLIRHYFDDWNTPSPPQGFRNSPLTAGQSSETIERDIESVYGFLSIPCPARDLSKREAALSTLIFVLSGYFNSRLNQALKEEESLCTTIELASEDTSPVNSLLFSFTTDDAGKVERILEKYRANLHLIANEPPSASELATVRASMRAARVFECENAFGAGAWISNMAFPRNDLAKLDKYLNLERSVDSEDVSEAAASMLKDVTRATLTIAYPRGSNKPSFPQDILDCISLSTPSITVSRRKTTSEPEFLGKLDCGGSVYGWRSPSSSTFACRTYIPFDILNEPLRGISFTCNDVMLKGTRRKNASELSRLFESVGGILAAAFSPTHLGIESSLLAFDSNLTLTTIPEILAEAAFEKTEIDKSVWATIARLARMREQNLAVAWRTFQTEFLADSPYGVQVLGEETDLKKLTTPKIKRYAQAVVAPHSMLFCVAGRFERSQVIETLNRSFSQYAFSAKNSDLPGEGRFDGKERRVDVEMNKEQSAVIVGFPIEGQSSERFHYWEVANVIIGAGQDSRLFTKLRDEESLAYSIHSMLLAGRSLGIVAVQMLTSHQKHEDSIDRVFDEIELIFKHGVSKREFESARRFLVEQAVNACETSNGKCGEIAKQVLLGFPPERVLDRVTKIRSMKYDDFVGFLSTQSMSNWGVVQVGPKVHP